MLDTNICSFIMRKQPQKLLEILQFHASHRDKIVISAITYSELRYGAIGKKASPKHNIIVNQFIERIDSILPWDSKSVDESTKIKKSLTEQGNVISNNDIAIAGHAISVNAILITNNTKEFIRVDNLTLEDWTSS
jgi:tRNA(fMet)-specific endonuclease VapC